MIPIDAKKYLYIALAALFGLAALYCYSGRDNGPGTDATRTNLQSAGDQQRQAAERLGDIENRLNAGEAEAGRISEGIGGVADRIADVEARIAESQNQSADSAGLVREGQGIIRSVRERNTERAQTP